MELRPSTTFSDQLRYQCNVHGYPIVDDRIYGNFRANKMILSHLQRIDDSVRADAAATEVSLYMGEDNKSTPKYFRTGWY